MAHSTTQDHSTLEVQRPLSGLVVPTPRAGNTPLAPIALGPTGYFGFDARIAQSETSSSLNEKETRPDAGNQDSSKQVTNAPSQAGVPHDAKRVGELSAEEAGNKPRRICHLRPVLFLGLLVLFILIMIAVIVGAVVGTQNHKKPQATSAPLPASNDTTSPVNITMRDRSDLASIAWNDTDGTTHRRLYFQDTNNSVRESLWDSKGQAWTLNPALIGHARADSPLAAAVSGLTGAQLVRLPPAWYSFTTTVRLLGNSKPISSQ